MQIISHRGFWKEESEKNKIEAFKRARKLNLGVETDFRDWDGRLVVSHNMPDKYCLYADKFFKLYENTDCMLALNIKADGIQEPLKELLEKYQIRHYFCFDMSIPDTLEYIRCGIDFFTRESEYEPQPAFLEAAAGVWVDAFLSDDWITEDKLERYLGQGKSVCIVSPELHGRDYREVWKRYADMHCMESGRIYLCTDEPLEAGRFFHE